LITEISLTQLLAVSLCYNSVQEDSQLRFHIILEPAEEGGYNVTVPALDGCFSQGETEEEAVENAKEAIICYMEGLEKLNHIKSGAKHNIKTVEVRL